MLIAPESKLLNLLGFGPTGDLGPLTGYTSKRGKGVWYLKAPPKTPASPWQLRVRNKFRTIAGFWAQLTAAQRNDWAAAGKAAGLNITGYNLFVWYQHTLDAATIATIERQSGINLLPFT